MHVGLPISDQQLLWS